MVIILVSTYFITKKTGLLNGLAVKDITRILGFTQNDQIFIYVQGWRFQIDGENAAIWDSDGSSKMNIWSTFGPKLQHRFSWYYTAYSGE